MSKPTILTLLPYYLPGHEAGGPIRTIANMVEHLGDEFQFRIVTSDRDAFETEPYEKVTPGEWTEVGEALVHYTSPDERTFSALRRLISETRHDVLYLNSFFFWDYTIKPLLLRRLGLIPDRPVVLAPRGEFSKGALQFKRTKKRTYVMFARLTGLYKDVKWQASSDQEATDIRRVMSENVDIHVAPNLPPPPGSFDETSSSKRWPEKESGALRVLFLSRIVPKKNLDYAIRVLSEVKGCIRFTLVGPIDDEKYWEDCKGELERLPESVEVQYLGSVEHEEVPSIMASHDLFLLPTRGENYGHVIQEAVSAGTPVLISDQTPWRGLEAEGVGWDRPLDEKEAFRKAIEQCVAMPTDEYRSWRDHVAAWGRQKQRNPPAIESNRALFESLL